MTNITLHVAVIVYSGWRRGETMDNAYLVGAAYAVLGIVLLFFRPKLPQIAVTVLGILVGIHLGQLLVAWWSLGSPWAFLVIVLCVVLLATLGTIFNERFAAASVGYLLALLAYGLCAAWGVSHVL